MLVANFMSFRRKRLEKKIYINNFSLKKNSKTNLFGFIVLFAKNRENIVKRNIFTKKKICRKKFS